MKNGSATRNINKIGKVIMTLQQPLEDPVPIETVSVLKRAHSGLHMRIGWTNLK